MKPCAFLLAASIGLFAGPTWTSPVSDKNLATLTSRPIVVVYREATPFRFVSPGRAFGTVPLLAVPIFGAFADAGISTARSRAAGKKLIEENGIEDPAKSIRNHLFLDLRGLGAFRDVQLLDPDETHGLNFAKDYRGVVPEGALVLDVQTIEWQLTFLGRKWDRYRIRYKVQARLLDPRAATVLATTRHLYSEDYDKAGDAPVLDAMLVDHAAMFKQKLQQASREAIAPLRKGLFPAETVARLGENDMKSFATRYTAAWCSHDPQQVAAYFGESGSLQINDGKPSVGRDAIAQAALEFFQAFPDLVVEMNAIERHGDRWHYRWTLSGTNTGPGGTGNTVRISGYEDWKIGPDGLVAESFGHYDAADYDRQIKGL